MVMLSLWNASYNRLGSYASTLWGVRAVKVVTFFGGLSLLYLFLKKRFTPPKNELGVDLTIFCSYPTTQELIDAVDQNRPLPTWHMQQLPAPERGQPYDWRLDPNDYDFDQEDF
jgi:hypothetical protein